MRTVIFQALLLATLGAGCSAGKKAALEMCVSSDPKARHSAVAELMRHLSSEAGSTEEEVSASFTGDDAIFDLEIVGLCGAEFISIWPKRGAPDESRAFGLTPTGEIYCERARAIERYNDPGGTPRLPWCGPAPP
jgi:hypothetical protein